MLIHSIADLKIILTESCYKIVEERLSWENARSKCASLGYGSDLATVHTSQEKDFIRGHYFFVQFTVVISLILLWEEPFSMEIMTCLTLDNLGIFTHLSYRNKIMWCRGEWLKLGCNYSFLMLFYSRFVEIIKSNFLLAWGKWYEGGGFLGMGWWF